MLLFLEKYKLDLHFMISNHLVRLNKKLLFMHLKKDILESIGIVKLLKNFQLNQVIKILQKLNKKLMNKIKKINLNNKSQKVKHYNQIA